MKDELTLAGSHLLYQAIYEPEKVLTSKKKALLELLLTICNSLRRDINKEKE